MAQSNLAREPSMDEILASIRKIIESNEATGPGLPANDHGPMSDSYYSSDRAYLDEEQPEDIQLTIDDTVFPDFDVADGASVQQPTLPQSYPDPEMSRAAASAPLSLADVAARVRAASERQSMPRESVGAARESDARAPQPAPRQERAQPVPQVDVTAARPDTSSSVGYREPAPVEASTHGDRAHAAEVEASIRAMARDVVAPHLSVEEPVSSDVVVAESPVVAQPDIAVASQAVPQMSPDVRAKDASAIISDAVSEQVSRSFGELALAIDSSPRRSFDEIAEDMLRPMLQEWLDDNLPTLVERLVREEIERVARGPRR
ncbi:hypothetical protein ASG25_00555 [Rhizobium sp. Leaf384]|uniref:PopZ family protein n=1 Tax=unclassified Rhizobium TaxID=2613769 RepID=UPI000715D3F6|nr:MULTISPECIES: DUF2497 domain-containing protein [unclassified Rhizobium]KQS74434.1 hypothetical protein ASG58_15750 [Rhizobium sp. Leaf383]KQS80171.1 hypothetical protein ASG25_00555 [Rhizobium sp. Leaf384]